MAYFETNKKITTCGEIEICDIYDIQQPKPINSNQKNQEYKSIFELKTAKRDWIFKCRDKNKLTLWLKHLKERALPKVITSGYLYLEEFKKWNKYYFELNVIKQIRLYLDDKKRKYKETILTKSIKKIGLTDQHNGKSNILILAMKDNTSYVLAADSNDIRVLCIF